MNNTTKSVVTLEDSARVSDYELTQSVMADLERAVIKQVRGRFYAGPKLIALRKARDEAQAAYTAALCEFASDALTTL